ncbi:arginyltransferase [Psychrosphaera sp. B3R10]|uniref:arginyltransferase n=1 Tax=unclassified Psychrosphaera TaxID=2641570 RepID=UPI001C0A5188|nr:MULTISPECIES: arginyltransferase [unclassified Psychrosphaera]MBU2881314.1 arginyltransferase [Psychrosphaera sp. I2R16]MBU2988413.1 arginyltransferase [Psychrosphaera sp. B3R10]MDO6720087.1 arginyltransferase [Psychrosphaera sp. 1_MG-2023]
MPTVKFGLSAPFQCGYLSDREEQLLVYLDQEPLSEALYSKLQAQGFRRSEDYVYRPHCEDCQACQSIRLPVSQFQISRSQKRVLKKAQGFSVKIQKSEQPEYYPLFERYVNEKHLGGVMYPANYSQLTSFSQCDWLEQLFIELYDKDKLIAVAICDVTSDSLSAVYTFYDPEYANFSIGTLMILQQINLTEKLEKPWLYLGYYIRSCQKMNYKVNYRPYQINQNGRWLQIPHIIK